MANELKGLVDITTGVEKADANDTGLFDLTTQQVTDAAASGEAHNDTYFPGGVVDRAETSLTLDAIDPKKLIITLTGAEFNFYESGTKYTKTSTETFDITDVEGLHAIYYDGGVLTETVNPTGAQFGTIILEKALIAVVLWNATDKVGLPFDERHGCQMPSETHSYLHLTRGCMYKNGLTIGGFDLDESGDLDVDAQFSMSAGQVADEDITANVAAMSTGDTYVVLWKNASGNFRWDTKTNFAVLTAGTGRLAYNNAGTPAEVDNNKFVLYHIYGSNVLIDTGAGWENQPIVFMGTAQYGNVSAARDAATSEIATLDLTGFAYERKALYSVIFKTATGMANAVKGAMQSIDGDPTHAGVDYRSSALNQNIAMAMYHEALLNRNEGDQHTQYVYSGTRGAVQVIGDSIALPKASTEGIQVDIVTPTWGWRDLLGEITPRSGGGAAPAFTAYRGGQVKSYAFSAADIIDRLSYHIPHDYKKGTPIFLHVHWGHNGTAISGSLVLDYYTSYCKGHNQSGEIFGAEIDIQHTILTPDVATYPRWGHFINEIQVSNVGGDATHLDTALLEPDGLIEIALVTSTIPVITGSAASNLPYIFKLDVHYQTTNIGTKEKAPDFYV